MFTDKEARYAMLRRTDPDRADDLMRRAQKDVDDRWHLYEQTAGIERGGGQDVEPVGEPADRDEEGEAS
jgi:pyruvate-ferredoxin/flavodoxin oxidoreductase